MKIRAQSLIAAMGVCFAISADATVRYVDVNNTTPSPPYTNWATAANVIQDAVDVAVAGDEVVVTNGVYATGGRVVSGAMTNRVAVNKPVTVRSVNGSAVTVIQGYQVPGVTNGDSAIRCVYLTNGAALIGFTLTNGATRSSGNYWLEVNGGGVLCEPSSGLVSNCTVIGNSASYEGGGVYNGTLNNCKLIGNSASSGGGGARSATLNNCTFTANSAPYGGGAIGGTLNSCTLTGNSASERGGGAYGGRLNNCIIYYNTAPLDPNHSGSAMNYCCTTPLPSVGAGNFTAEPQLASSSRLSANSPCLGAGNATNATGVDIDGEAWGNRLPSVAMSLIPAWRPAH